MLKNNYTIIFLFTINYVNCARILAINPTPSISHQIPFRFLIDALIKRGHHITFLTTDPIEYDSKQYKNLTIIDVKSISYDVFKFEINFTHKNWFVASTVITFYNLMLKYTDLQLRTPQMQKIINDPTEKFDLCFVEAYAPPFLSVKDRFNCSLILVSSTKVYTNYHDAVGNPSNPILYQSMFTPFIKPYTFMQKVYLVLQDLYYRYIHYCKFMPKFDALSKQHFGKNIRSSSQIQNDIDMLFINIIPILDDVSPIGPSTIYINGLHLKTNTSLPLKFQEIMDEAVDGVIYFSLGSNVKMANLPLHYIKAFVDAFKEMPYTILWKWENDTMIDKPSNVIISKWMPQQDILAHFNVKLFITQGGQQSMEEAIHFRVPLICLPFVSDQFTNAKKVTKFGLGAELYHETLSKQIIIDTIQKVIGNSIYKETISNLSDLINDQPQGSLERAVWWTEYVLRHKGASHLKAPAVGVSFYEYFLLDVLAIMLGCLLMATFTIVLLIKFFIICIINFNKTSQTQNKKKQ